jgi:hypothetical protein
LTFGQYPEGQNYAQWIQSSFTNPTTATYHLVLQPLGGNVGIGTSTTNNGTLNINGAPGKIAYYNSNNYNAEAGLGVLTGFGDTFGINARQSGGILAFGTNNTERARIDSGGRLLVGTTAVPDVSLGQTGFSVSATELVFSSNTNGGNALSYWRTQAGNSFAASYWNGNSNVGNIAVTTTSTTYNTSSDYRLKHDIQPLTGALAKVAALKPVTYKWNIDDSESQGFIAHELQEVVPECVTGEKDAVGAEGKPQYQGIDTSFLVATLTAAIQEQQAIITALTARVAALESN